MATTVKKVRDGWRVTFAETSVATGHELTIEGGFSPEVTVTNFEWDLTSGDGATITPALGVEASHATTADGRVAAYTAAAAGRDNTAYVISGVTGGKLYLQLEPNAGTNNAVSGVLSVLRGARVV